MSKEKIIVGLSGGVDSSVAALRLIEQGYEVEAMFMKNWEEDDTQEYCSAAEDLHDAQQVAEKLGIILHTVNFSADYWDRVFEHFLQEYQSGRTPNPDIMCNKEIKFRAFLDFSLAKGATKIATGHYARLREHGDQFEMLKGLDANKDQTYFLYTLNQEQLSKSLFPVGELEKSEVRRLAKKHGFITHDKKDSTGICFIGERRFSEFLGQYLKPNPGAIETENGEVIGEHTGLHFYTIGQRQGLGIGGKDNHQELPWYVAQKQLESNTLVVVQGHDHPLLLASKLTANQLNWCSGESPVSSFSCRAKIRYRQQDVACQVEMDGTEQCQVTFTDPQRAITLGQSVVFYADDRCLGGGIIDKVSA